MSRRVARRHYRQLSLEQKKEIRRVMRGIRVTVLGILRVVAVRDS